MFWLTKSNKPGATSGRHRSKIHFVAPNSELAKVSRIFLNDIFLDLSMKYDIKIHSTCLSITMTPSDVKQIELRPFKLACGALLQVGDKFTEISSKGCAALPAIKLALGWYQEFKGMLNIEVDGKVGTLALFDAYEISTDKSVFDTGRRKSGEQCKYLAYFAIEKNGELGFVNHTQNYRITTCDAIARFEHSPNESLPEINH